MSGKYTVQLGPYRDRKAVATARADLAKRGYEARVVGQKLELGNFDGAEAGRQAGRPPPRQRPPRDERRDEDALSVSGGLNDRRRCARAA